MKYNKNNINRKITENPLIDEIVYECQQIIKGIILKDEKRADDAEKIKSIKEADIYHDIQMGTDRYEYYEYTYDIFMQIPSMDPQRAWLYLRNQLPIPNSLKPELQKIARQKWLKYYQETNEYYRCLAGLPPLNSQFIYLSEEEYLMIPIESFDITKPIHECTISEADLLYSSGVVDKLKDKYPEAKYLNFLGEKSIDPYIARRSPKFSLLYMPPVDSPEVTNKWRERFEINRVYVLQTIYSEAYKFHSDYYDRFMMIMIILMTFEDMIIYSPEYIIERNLFDLRTIQYIFEACGVEFFPEIPLKYQKRLVKNLNRLIKYKSSAKCMVDIVSLFGYENMELFKYYIMKTPNVKPDGSYIKDTYTDPSTGKEVLDLESNYKLQFLKVPLLEIADDYIQDPFNYIDYESTVQNDIYWNGVYTQDYVKHEILKHEFNLHKSKYISIDTVYSLTEMQFQMVYFINMLLYSEVNTDNLLVDVPELSSNIQFKLTDLIITLFSLSYLYNEIRDNIIYDPVQAMAVKGFNFDTDLSKLSDYIEKEGYTLEDVGLDRFKNPNPMGIKSWKQLDEIYTDNKYTYDKLVRLMNNANNYDEYKVYRNIFESLYVTKLNFNIFKVDGLNRKPNTYKEYLLYSNIRLHQLIEDCELIPKHSDRQLEITRIINYIIEDIYNYIDQDKFKFVFNGIPTVSLDYIRKYIFNILNFFKSYKVDVINSNIIYKFDDRLDNKVRVLDKILFHYIFTKSDKIHISDCFKLLDNFQWKEQFHIVEKMYMDITYWKQKHFLDNVFINDKDHWKEILVHVNYSDYINITKDIISRYNSVYTWGLHIPTRDEIYCNISKKCSSDIRINDCIYFNYINSNKKVIEIVDNANFYQNNIDLIVNNNKYDHILQKYNINRYGNNIPTNIDVNLICNGIIYNINIDFIRKEIKDNKYHYIYNILTETPTGKGELQIKIYYSSFNEYNPQIIAIPYRYI